ncbi:glycosyltransferase [Cytobacillus dafuensis]|nr:glycosyltransferase [Cytobacillus dafuensis]
MEVSIIMPSYNRYPLNLLSLHSLENQTFDLSKMEVILIDDASTDQTEDLKNYRPPYRFIYIKTRRNIGIAAARNLGVKMSKGKVIVFLDAEMIVDPNYIRNRYRHHLKSENAVVIGGKPTGKLYTCLFPEFGKKQMKDIARLIRKRPVVKERIEKSINKKVISEMIGSTIKTFMRPIQLLSKEDIYSFRKLKPFTVKRSYNEYDLLTYLDHNLEKSPLVWLACLGNLSIRRSFFDRVRGYEEAFKGWGPEDAEFAYRLYKADANFVVEPSLIRYHQEHPKHKILSDEGDRNWLIFQEKHPYLEVCVRAIGLIEKKDYKFMENIIEESLSLKKEYHNQYKKFQDSLILLLKEIRILKSRKKTIRHLMQSSGIEADAMKKKQIFKERNEIESYGKYKNLIKLFDLLTNK